jgi:type I restriction enzyme, R subunit
MQSTNFEFLRPNCPELADLGGFAELYAQSDPSSSLIKLRQFGENLVADFFMHHRLPRLPRASFIELLQALEEQALVPAVILDKLHALRIQGNQAVHGAADAVQPHHATWILREAFDLAKWVALTLHGDADAADREFATPAMPESKRAIKREKKAALQKLAAQELQMQQLLRELEQTRLAAETAEKTLEEQKQILAKANHSVAVLQFDEASTRQLLIDQMLVQAGWNVGPGLESTSEVGKEVEVTCPHNATGVGKADYVLWNDDGKPLAVIEAKRTAKDASDGRAQAKLYADGLEAQHGQRPVIFYTNGYDIFVWDDAKAHIPRRIYGYYSKDSLQYCLWQTAERQPLTEIGPQQSIIDRQYQIEAVKRVCERFQDGRRKALIVQATGTGKTRVAIALCELMIRARWAKRILFLCDRRELRKQANNVFAAEWAKGINGEPRVYVTASTADDRQQSIYLATYPAMSKCYQRFDVGFFDLVIADESHRSIYNRYREIFLYFDAYQVGLTATPRNVITHDTYRMFECEDNDPTAHFSYQDAIDHVPPYLTHFRVTSHTTKFLREGIHYADMSPEQRQQLEQQVEDAESVDFKREAVDKSVFNKDTDRRIIRNLMENGTRNALGQNVGKSIIFARNHQHAVQLCSLFEEMYPQFMKPKQEFCAVIDNYVSTAEQLIDDFKGEGNNDNLNIAISVDMLDTGIDIPEVVNLVFAKPVKSYVKFWQMLGRGTRLCPNLFGSGRHKEAFTIFDHWGNFEYFGENPPEEQPQVQKSLLQQLFETRLILAEEAVARQDFQCFKMAVELLIKDARSLPDDTIGVREKWKQVKLAQQDGVIEAFDASTLSMLRNDIAPLMQWRALSGREDAYRFDLLSARLQLGLLRGSADCDDLRDEMQQQVAQLPINLAQVQAKQKWITQVRDARFWQDVYASVGMTSASPDHAADAERILEYPTPRSELMKAAEGSAEYDAGPGSETGTTGIQQLDEVRRELRGIMHCRNKLPPPVAPPLEIDVTDSGEDTHRQAVKLDGLELAAYRQRVEHALRKLMDQSEPLQKIRAGLPVGVDELRELSEQIVFEDPDLNVDDLLVQFPNKANRLDLAIRQIVGLDADAVNRHFTKFIQKYPGLSSFQMRFLALVQQHIVNYGKLEIAELYEEPFVQLHIEGVDGVFTEDEQVNDLLDLITDINQFALSES